MQGIQLVLVPLGQGLITSLVEDGCVGRWRQQWRDVELGVCMSAPFADFFFLFSIFISTEGVIVAGRLDRQEM